MKVTLESTSKVVVLATSHLDEGISCRAWEGHTESGIPVHCYIPLVAVNRDQDASQLEEELLEQWLPSPDVEAIPMRMII